VKEKLLFHFANAFNYNQIEFVQKNEFLNLLS